MQTAIAYTRVSSIEQVKDGNSLSTQKHIISDWAEKNNVKILEWFVEEGESAKTADRTKLKEMLKYSVEHHDEIDLLLLYKLDRLSRQTADYHALKAVLARQSIQVFSVSEQFDDTPIGKAMETITSAIAQLDNDNRAKVCKDGMVEGAKAGRWMWPAPIGYTNGRDTTGKRNIVLDTREGFVDILRSAWDLVALGYNETETLKIVNNKLEDKGYRKIPKQTISRMFRNEIYIGVINAFGKRIQSPTIEPLVNAELFYKVLGILNKDKNKGNKYNKYNPKYPLRGILFCKNGHKMTASSPKGRNKHYPKYHCMKCSGKHMNYDVDKVNNQFLDYISNIQMDSSMEKALEEAIKLNLGETLKHQQKKIRKYEKRLIEIDAEKEQIVKKNISSVIPDRTAQKMLGDLETEETTIRLELNEMKRPDDSIMDILEFGIEKLRNLSETIKQITDPKIRFRFQKWLFPTGLVYDGEKFGTAVLPSVLQIKRTAFVGVSNEKISFGEAVGSKSVLLPVLIIGVSLFISGKMCGIYGIAIASLGMLSFVATTVSIDAFGPISDNAGGIAESCHLQHEVRAITDMLDAVGNTTAAIGKGFAIGSAAFATVSLISAYVGSYSDNPANPILNIANFTVMAGAIIGGALVEFFAALLAENTIMSAHALAVEGDRQLSIPGVIEGTVKPDYQKCIALASKNALARMVVPSILALLIPVVAGFIFGAPFVGGILIGATVVAIPRAIFMGNSGGAWDNAKKYTEEGLLKLTPDDVAQATGVTYTEEDIKNGVTKRLKEEEEEEYSFEEASAHILKEVHKTTVIGDTIGDTNKDVIGVALDIFIKTMSTVANNIAPIIIHFHIL